MSVAFPTGYALNRTRQVYLATRLHIAKTHWSRFRGLMWTDAGSFVAGQGLWIVPSRGVHTFAMRFPIDVIYLDGGNTVIYAEENLKPWRVAPVRMSAASVLELPGSTLSSTRTAVGDEIEIAPQEAGRA
ncbi:MAG TPA: DUF192 domain-containing protein [Terriglobales bacterium]|jgi:uncharacterized membrane protein (UPF0127 family)|nr:DUF192 domain-containing protein [Terriglobales bacterium]